MRHPEHHVFAHTPDSLRQWCVERGLKPFRANQIMEWVYGKGVVDPTLMTNLSAGDRELIARQMTFLSSETLAHQRASDGTQKLLVEWIDPGPSERNARLNVIGGSDSTRQTECVIIPADGRRTACISSQVGCPVGCRFCASGLGGLDGNLSAGRIVEQVWRLSHHLDVGAGQASRITNVVFMGMGEPLANFEAVTSAVRTIAAPWGLGISARKITISTVGLPKAIERLGERLELPVTLALSLHAPNDELRRQLIPWAEYTTIGELLSACQAWFEKTGREITLEYIMLGGVNDQPEHAHQLARVARTLRANINLIRYNEVQGLPFARPETDDVHAFQAILREKGVNAHIRASRGRDIAAACGQLRHERATV
jgi:23S rRNA (adenine2503-C2)-methyltransferase